MIERREREGERETKVKGEIREREREVKGIYRERVKGRGIERESERKKIERKRRFPLERESKIFGKSPIRRNKA